MPLTVEPEPEPGGREVRPNLEVGGREGRIDDASGSSRISLHDVGAGTMGADVMPVDGPVPKVRAVAGPRVANRSVPSNPVSSRTMHRPPWTAVGTPI